MMTINLETKLISQNRRAIARENAVLGKQEAMDREIEKLLAGADEEYQKNLMAELGLDYKLKEAEVLKQQREKFAHLPQERIFDVESIKRLCIRYTLRMLPTAQYKGALDPQIGSKLEAFRKLVPSKAEQQKIAQEKAAAKAEIDFKYYAQQQRDALKSQYDAAQQNAQAWADAEAARQRNNAINAVMGITGSLMALSLGSALSASVIEPQSEFFICAPAESFELRDRPNPDPLLFAALGDNKFYLIHKWGDDLSALRRLKTLYFQNQRAILSVWGCLIIGAIGVYVRKIGLSDFAKMTSWIAHITVSCMWGITCGFFFKSERVTDETTWNSPFES